jgi:hypothetical protein
MRVTIEVFYMGGGWGVPTRLKTPILEGQGQNFRLFNKTNSNKQTRKDTQPKFYKVMAVPVLLYGCENWALNRVDRRNIETAETKFLRRVAGFTVRDEVRNTTTREELQIFNIGERIQ